MDRGHAAGSWWVGRTPQAAAINPFQPTIEALGLLPDGEGRRSGAALF